MPIEARTRQSPDDLKTRLGLARVLRYQLLTTPASTNWEEVSEWVDLFNNGGKTNPFHDWSGSGFNWWF